MEALIYAPTAQAFIWRQAETERARLSTILQTAVPSRAYCVAATVAIDPDFTGLIITRLPAEPPLLVFEALERPVPFITRPRDFWYPQLTAHIRPERHPLQTRADMLVVWGPPRGSLSAIRDSVAVHHPHTGHYIGRAFWRVDRKGFWGCWSDSTENIGPALTLSELLALLTADRGIYAD